MQIYKRSEMVNFMNTGTKENPVYTRMQGFTSGGKELNPKKYTRQYIDEDFERETTTGYSPNIPYTLDRIKNNAVHEKIVAVHENELKGETCEIITVDMVTKEAWYREYDINPDKGGDGTDAYAYSGNFHANGSQVKGTATVASNGLTATFSADVPTA